MEDDRETNEPSGWLRLGERAATDLVDARLQLHWAVQLVSAVGNTLLPAAADDGHTSLEWLVAPSLLAGRRTADAPTCRAALRPADLHLLVLGERDDVVAELALHGTTMGQATVWLEQEISACRRRSLPRPLRRPELVDLPDHAVGHGALFDGRDTAAFAEIARWYAHADSILRPLAARTPGAAPVRCWPHHFDIATLVALETGGGADTGTIGIGMSPGDASYAEPYWYVMPWPRPAQPRLAMLAGAGEWHRDGWLGAVLTGSTIKAESSAGAQARRVEIFLGSAVDACRELLRA